MLLHKNTLLLLASLVLLLINGKQLDAKQYDSGFYTKSFIGHVLNKIPMSRRHETLISQQQLIDNVNDANPAQRVYNGNKAERGFIPSQVRIYTQFSDNSTIVCGGTVIRTDWILTAAHCLTKPNLNATEILVVMGVVDVNDRQRVVRRGIRYYYHRDYSEINLANDIAVIQIEAVEFNEYIQAARPPPRYVDNDLLAGHKVLFSGFGRLDDENVTNELYWGNMMVAALDYCRESYAQFGDILCLNTCLASSCPGDDGGPLFWKDPNLDAYVQIGIAAFGNKDSSCTNGNPVGYTRVSGYLDWLMNVIEKDCGDMLPPLKEI